MSGGRRLSDLAVNDIDGEARFLKWRRHAMWYVSVFTETEKLQALELTQRRRDPATELVVVGIEVDETGALAKLWWQESETIV